MYCLGLLWFALARPFSIRGFSSISRCNTCNLSPPPHVVYRGTGLLLEQRETRASSEQDAHEVVVIRYRGINGKRREMGVGATTI
jgi:hypothetical protein